MRNVLWDTVDVPAKERFTYWREAVCQAYLPLEPGRLSDRIFHGQISGASTDALQCTRVHTCEATINRTARGIKTLQDDTFFANLQLEGTAMVEQRGRRRLARAGDIVLVDTNAPFSIKFEEGCHLICVTLPGDWIGRRLRHDPELIISNRLAAGYIRALEDAPNDLDALDDLAGEQLAALLTRSSSTSPFRDRPRDRRLLLQRILDFITAELSNPALSAKYTCARLGISRSHLFAVLEQAGMTFAGHVRKERLRHCRMEIADPRLADTPIAAIAERWGFTDGAAFTRTFRRVYGVPPSRCRPHA